jgi:hypothetical protein
LVEIFFVRILVFLLAQSCLDLTLVIFPESRFVDCRVLKSHGSLHCIALHICSYFIICCLNQFFLFPKEQFLFFFHTADCFLVITSGKIRLFSTLYFNVRMWHCILWIPKNKISNEYLNKIYFRYVCSAFILCIQPLIAKKRKENF